MITLETEYTCQRWVCLSTDTKPTFSVTNGSRLLEMDTGKTYMFDEENATWEEVSLIW